MSAYVALAEIDPHPLAHRDLDRGAIFTVLTRTLYLVAGDRRLRRWAFAVSST
jgi:hypothetical protein